MVCGRFCKPRSCGYTELTIFGGGYLGGRELGNHAMLQNLMFTFGGVLFGGLITWFYYKKSGNDLARLRRLSTIILNAMEDGGPLKLNRDESGEIQGRVIPLSGTLDGGTAMWGGLQVLRAQNDGAQPRSQSSSNRPSPGFVVFRKLRGKL